MLRMMSGLIAGLMMVLPTGVVAAGEQPNPVDLLFNARHLDLVPKGMSVKYKYEHAVSDEKLLGAPFSDDIKIDVTDVTDSKQSVVNVTVFTGERQRPIQNYDGLTINPVFIWFLDKSVDTYRLLSGGNQIYLKGRFRDAFIDKATVESIEIPYNGKTVAAHRVTVVPFDGDPNANKMQGFEKSKFTIVVSKEVPGYFVQFDSEIFSSQAGTGKVQDKIVLVSAEGK